jgi:hypothetical protein
VPEPDWQGDELPDAVPFGAGATEEGAYDERPSALVEPVPFPDGIAKLEYRLWRIAVFIAGGILAVALAAGVTYVMLLGESAVATPPIAAVSPPKVVVSVQSDQGMPPHRSVDGAQTPDKTKLVTPGVGKVASDNAAASGDDHPAAGGASASDAEADQVSAGKPPPDASPAPAAIAPVEPGSVPASASGDATPASDDGPSAGGNASAASAAAAIGSPPPTKPADKPAALAGRGGVIDLAKTRASKATLGSPVAPPGRVFVQFSAQKSETAARSSYHRLLTKFPTILGKLDPNIQRADLGGKGVFYRVRVGPFALADAQKICGSYKAGGGSNCLIARH